jgi:hypothetical protein
LAVTKVADQQDFIIESAKMIWNPREAPRRVQLSAGDQALKQVAFGVKDIDETVIWTGHIVMLFTVLCSECDVEEVVDVRDAEGCPSRSPPWVRAVDWDPQSCQRS